jgi:hypothetical protein
MLYQAAPTKAQRTRLRQSKAFCFTDFAIALVVILVREIYSDWLFSFYKGDASRPSRSKQGASSPFIFMDFSQNTAGE